VCVPLILGGNTEPALRRAARTADGWFSSGNPTFDEAVRLRARLGELVEAAGRAEGLAVFVRMAGRDRAELDRYEEHGFEHVTVWANQLWPVEGELAEKQERFAAAAAELLDGR
jgi:alkanesulfonate monooxygenase SsuD/methylene tetrahydromethanopterin reductase-like flavin-dependent oxidoreductase (luciferase family)